jgi:hypothetical protein
MDVQSQGQGAGGAGGGGGGGGKIRPASGRVVGVGGGGRFIFGRSYGNVDNVDNTYAVRLHKLNPVDPELDFFYLRERL